MTRLAWPAIAFCALLVASCGTMLPPVPQTPREAVAAAEASLTAVLKDLDAARQEGLIDEEAEKAIDTAVKSADSALDAAQLAVRGGDTQATETWLKATRDAIADLRAELREARDE